MLTASPRKSHDVDVAVDSKDVEMHSRGSVIVANYTNPRMLHSTASVHKMFEQRLDQPAEQEQLEAMINHYDKDGNGQFSRDEVKEIVKDKMFEHWVSEERGRTAKRVAEDLNKFHLKNRALKFTILGGAIVVVLLAGLMAITNEAQKESHVDVIKSTLLSNMGTTVGTAKVKRDVALADLPRMSGAELAALDVVSYPTDQGDRVLYMKVGKGGRERKKGKKESDAKRWWPGDRGGGGCKRGQKSCSGRFLRSPPPLR